MRRLWLLIVPAMLMFGCTMEVVSEEKAAVEAQRTSTSSAPQRVVSAGVEAKSGEDLGTKETRTTDGMETSDPALPGTPLFTFVAGEPRWYTVDDNVMGGVSNSTVSLSENGDLYFSGRMSLENNGGFASVRSEWSSIDLSDSDGLLLRVLGDGKSYRIRVRTDATDRSVSYNALFETTPDEWQLVYIPFAEMVPTYFGYVVDVGPIDRERIGSFGFMLSDKQPGEFELLVDRVHAVTEEDLEALRG